MIPQPRRQFVLFGPVTTTEAATVGDFLRQETVGGGLMLLATVVALVWANIDFGSYDHLRHVHLGPLSLQHWAADGVLAIFFFVAGLELKRELIVGALARPAEALVPIAAAACGMAVPAVVYLAISAAGGGRLNGWAIPMATDIAFALAVLAVVGRGLPTSLRVFLLTLAIVDDLGAILVIALVFTTGIQLLWLLGAVGCAALWWVLQWRRIDLWALYVPLGVACWWCALQSGIHPTISGVLLGLLTRSSALEPHPPVDRWEHFWRPVSAGFAVPVFALLSAGVAVSGPTLAGLFREPVALGIILGLVVGKAVGVFGGAYLTARFTRAELAGGLYWREVFSVGLLSGIGFTVALLISDLAFADDPSTADHGKAAVLAASVLAAIFAAVSLRFRSAARRAEVPAVDSQGDPAGPDRLGADERSTHG